MRALLGAALMVAAGVVSAGAEEPPASAGWDQIRELYERAREAGEEVPGSVYEWVRRDLASIGDWQYRIADIPDGSAAELEELLGKFGESRWEVIWIERRGSHLRFFMKRRAQSYLGRVPAGQLRHLLPGADGD